MFYSKSTNGFYTTDIHGDTIPEDVVEITTEEWQDLLNGQSSGKQITANSKGYPVLIDPPAPVVEQPVLDPVAKLKQFLVENPDVAAILN